MPAYLFLIGLRLLSATPAPAQTATVEVTADEGAGRAQIIARPHGRSVSLLITTEPLSARGPRRTPPGYPIGYDAEWSQLLEPGTVRVFRAFELTVDGRSRTIPRRLTDRFADPGLASVLAALSRDQRTLFVCLYLGDGAGAAMGLWSVSLVNGGDRAWGGDLISEWEHPEVSTSDDCRAAGEAAPRLRGKTRRWPTALR